MILKMLDYRQGKEENHVFEEWTFLDNIESASSYFDEDGNTTCVRCHFRGGNMVTFAILNVAYLMSDAGKTIDKIIPADVEELGSPDGVIYNNLQEAAAEAMKD